jgi:hypothetical protein
MRTLLPALAFGLLASAAAGTAAGAATADGAAVVTCVAQGIPSGSGPPTPGESVCPANLTKDRDYELLIGEGDGTIELINPAGVVTISVPGSYDGNFKRDFRAAYSATYRLRVRTAY